MTKYYGQWETDKVIEKYFPNKTNGLCIEVGAYDGIKGSNTKYFENLGWNCLCIEPNKKIFTELLRNRSCPCFCVACGAENSEDGELQVVVFKSGIESSLTALSLDPRLMYDYRDAIEKRYTIDVPVRTLNHILQCNSSKIDFISIDTEGTELNVLMGLDLERYKPELLVVENNYDDSIITEYLHRRGYLFKERYHVNNFYLRNNND